VPIVFSQKKNRILYWLIPLLALGLSGPLAAQKPAWSQTEQSFSRAVDDLLVKAKAFGPQKVIVGFDSDFIPAGRLGRAAADRQRSQFKTKGDEIVSALFGLSAREKRRFRHVPFLVMDLDEKAIERLAGLPQVVSIQEDTVEDLVMDSSNAVIGSETAWVAGFDGAGWAVAVLDTGVDSTHPFFSTGSKVVSEACYSSDTESADSLCPGGLEESIVAGSGANCGEAIKGCSHGTHVAGTVAGNDGIGPEYGVARGADIIAIQVFSRFEGITDCGPIYQYCARAYVSDQVAALERVLDLHETFNIAAVNMSLGGSSYEDQATCDEEQGIRKLAIDNLRSVGIATVVASGNSGERSAINAPACISSAISVGATNDTDAVTSFSNVADFLALFAPGESISSSVPGGDKAVWQGTSMAAPHVAGAWAVLRQKSEAADVSEVLTALQATGTLVDDQRSGGTSTEIPRINLDLALVEMEILPPEFDSTPEAGANFEFGEVILGRTGDAMVLQVHNLGAGDLGIVCDVSGPESTAFLVAGCDSPVEPGATIEILVFCQPVQAGGNTGSLDLTTDDEDEGLVSFSLNCSGFDDLFFSSGFEDE